MQIFSPVTRVSGEPSSVKETALSSPVKTITNTNHFEGVLLRFLANRAAKGTRRDAHRSSFIGTSYHDALMKGTPEVHGKQAVSAFFSRGIQWWTWRGSQLPSLGPN